MANYLEKQTIPVYQWNAYIHYSEGYWVKFANLKRFNIREAQLIEKKTDEYRVIKAMSYHFSIYLFTCVFSLDLESTDFAYMAPNLCEIIIFLCFDLWLCFFAEKLKSILQEQFSQYVPLTVEIN